MREMLIIRRLSIYIVVCIITILSLSLIPSHAGAAQLQYRSLQLSTSIPSAGAYYQFSFSYTSAAPVGSVVFEFCDSPLDGVICNAPPGLDVSNVILQGQSGETGYSILNAAANTITLTRNSTAPGAEISSYVFSGAVNPSVLGEFYARIHTYSGTGGVGAYTDYGAVAVSTAQGIDVNTQVPPMLDFCVGQTVSGTDCSSASGDIVDLGILNPSTAASGTSQMVVGSNPAFGVVITANGTTMTSGNNIIPALNTPTVSAPGNAQFGVNLRANSNPPIGQDPSGLGVAAPSAQYNIPNEFQFHSGDVVAGATSTTDMRKFTVSYLANIPPDQPAGVYSATITYICTATF